MTNPYIILLSGELRVFDMPDKSTYVFESVVVFESAVDAYYSALSDAIKNAIKVENPEEAGYTIIEMKGRKFFYGPPTFGKQVPLENDTPYPLPNGLKVEILNTIPKNQIARLIKEPVNTEGATTRDEVTMGDAWMSGPEDFSKAIEEHINKYREMFPDSPIHVLGTVIPSLNQKEDLYTISKSVLYRNNDKSISFPSQEFKFIKEVRKNGEIQKTEVSEPFSESKLHETFDGPEITEGAAPEACPKCRTKQPENCHSMHCPMRKEPGNSAHGQHCGGLNCPAFEYACADVCMRPIIKEPVSEPSESQEEMMLELFQRLYDCLERGHGPLQNIITDFMITRK